VFRPLDPPVRVERRVEEGVHRTRAPSWRWRATRRRSSPGSGRR
jgi:hypothetical protein